MSNCELKPARVFEQFAEINKIPRPSKHEEQMIEYLTGRLARATAWRPNVDETGNVIIRKPATKGSRERADCYSCRATWIWCATSS